MEQKKCINRLFWILIVLLGITSTNAKADQNVYLREGGSLNGQSVDAGNYLIHVNPGEQIVGSVNVRVFSDSPSGNVVPLAATVTWGNRETQHWLVTSHFSPGWHDLIVNVNKTAPMESGLYYIIIAAEDTFTSAQIMSATAWNWSGGNVRWYDDNDLGWDWKNSHFYDARINGEVMATHLGGTGEYVLRPYGANWLAVYVTEPLISDDFESYDPNTWPLPDWIKNANASSDPTNNRVEVDPTKSGNQVLKLHGSVGGCWAALAFHQCSFPNEFTIECDVYNVSGTLTGCHPYHAQIGMRQGSSWTNPGRGLLLFGQNNEIIGSTSVLQTYETDRWYHVKICYQREGRNLNLCFWIDGVFKGRELKTIEDLMEELSFDHLGLTAQEGTVYFDNVVVYDSLLHLEVGSPDGGEELIAGSQYTITWDSLGDVGNVDIELSDDNGTSWAVVDSNTTNDGEYDWLVSEVTSPNCLIRISDANDPNIFDVSDDVFTIFQCLGPVPGDLNNDCYTNGKDLALLTAHWLRCANPLDPACGIVAYWNFDDGTAMDNSGNGNDGTIYYATATDGISGQALEFDGQTTYVEVPDSSKLDITGPITLSLWIKADVDQYFRVGLITKKGPYHPCPGYDLFLSEVNGECLANFVLRYIDPEASNGDMETSVKSKKILNDNKWHHVVATYDESNMKMFIDGLLDNQISYSDGYGLNDESLMIGLFQYGYNDGHGNLPNILNGKIDEARIFNRSLTDYEVTFLYQNP